jgi:hypothetical protein
MASQPGKGSLSRRASHSERQRASAHGGFLSHRGFLWLKVATILSLIIVASYAWVDVTPRHNGGSWYGYALGTIGALLILWLTALGLRKRWMTRGHWSLKAWTSAHVYLGLSLIIIGTLHSGFQFGWNVHTLAWALMLLVILSGIWGITAYATLPAALSNNRDQRTEAEMLEDVRALDRQLHGAALSLSPAYAAIVERSLAADPFAGSLWARLSGRYPRCATAQAARDIRQRTGGVPDDGSDPLERVDILLSRKQAALGRLRRHLKLRGLLEVWLYFHVPLTIALIAALTAHIISVFFYW